MAKLVLEDQPEILTFPVDTILDLKIEECTLKTQQGRNGDWQKLEFKFKILGIQATGDSSPISAYDNWITESIFGNIPAKLGNAPDNKCRLWAEAIFDQELGLGFELDTDMFLSRRVRGLTSQWFKDVGGTKYPRHQIESLLPNRSVATASAPATPATPQAGAPVGDPWATPAAAPATAGAPAAADPWGDSWNKDEPPF